jgi:hypothetical protein
MKKILLTLSVLASLNAANAQLIKNGSFIRPIEGAVKKTNAIAPKNINSNKKTRSQSGWMSYQDAIFISGTSDNSLWPLYGDSSLLVIGTTSNFNWWMHGMGTSFDPTSTKFKDVSFPFEVKKTDAYQIDSIEILGAYNRKPFNNYVDTLVIEIASTGTPGCTILQSASSWYGTNLGLADTTLRFATSAYNNTKNSMSSTVTGKVTIIKLLDAAAYADTNANGLNDWSIKLPTTLNVAANGKVSVLTTFRSGNQYAFNTNLDSANYWSQFVIGESNGTNTFPTPYTGEVTTGIIITSGDRYRTSDGGTPDYTDVSGVQYMQTTYWYGQSGSFEDPYYNFHVVCPTCNPTSTNDINSNITSSVSPNPATSDVTFSLNLKESAKNVTIEISNALGQVVKTTKVGSIAANTTSNTTISVSDLSAGMYIYTINADGQKTSNKLMVK